jgi:hypothetical protein
MCQLTSRYSSNRLLSCVKNDRWVKPGRVIPPLVAKGELALWEVHTWKITGKREVMPDDGLSSGRCPEVGFREVGNCVGAWRRLRARSRSTREVRCGKHAWAGAADTRSRRIFIAENHSSTALVGCSWTFDSALAGAAIVDGVAQHWLSWMLERSAHLVAGNPD